MNLFASACNFISAALVEMSLHILHKKNHLNFLLCMYENPCHNLEFEDGIRQKADIQGKQLTV